ncbi:MAG: hypothetical protein WC960_04140 [Bacteroidales bacterium]
MKSKKLLLLLLLTLTLSFGCDRLRLFFGMATSQELERVKLEQQREIIAQREADSLERASLDSLKGTIDPRSESTTHSKEGSESLNRFHIIVGSFKVHSNASKLFEKLQKEGYTPTLFHFKNGFDAISATSFKELPAAYNHLYLLEENRLFSGAIWIYDTKQNLHQ